MSLWSRGVATAFGDDRSHVYVANSTRQLLHHRPCKNTVELPLRFGRKPEAIAVASSSQEAIFNEFQFQYVSVLMPQTIRRSKRSMSASDQWLSTAEPPVESFFSGVSQRRGYGFLEITGRNI
jgi:hypothetical protein